MNLLADESVDRHIVGRLRQDGFEVLCVAEIEPSVADDVVLARPNECMVLLVTEDKDFGEIVFRDNQLVSGGVVLLRLSGLSAAKKAETVSGVFRERSPECAGHFSFIASGQIWIRPK